MAVKNWKTMQNLSPFLQTESHLSSGPSSVWKTGFSKPLNWAVELYSLLLKNKFLGIEFLPQTQLLWSISLQPGGDIRIFDPTEFIVWNIKGLRNWDAKNKEVENQNLSQRLNSFLGVRNLYVLNLRVKHWSPCYADLRIIFNLRTK